MVLRWGVQRKKDGLRVKLECMTFGALQHAGLPSESNLFRPCADSVSGFGFGFSFHSCGCPNF